MARICLSTIVALTVQCLVTLAEVQKQRGVSLPLKYGRGSSSYRAFDFRQSGNMQRGKRNSSPSVIDDLNRQLARIKYKYGTGDRYRSVPTPLPAPERKSFGKRATSDSLGLTDSGYDSSYFTSVQVGTPRKSYTNNPSTLSLLYIDY